MGDLNGNIRRRGQNVIQKYPCLIAAVRQANGR
jgi:hypothetical protein